MTIPYAHSTGDAAGVGWEPLSEHAGRVASACNAKAAPLGLGELGRVGGLLHDIGKCSPAFQAYLHQADGLAHGPDHSTAGAVEARRLYPGPLGRILAFAIAGHHAGLADGGDLARRLGKTIEPYEGWQEIVGALPNAAALAPRLKAPSPHRGFSLAFLTRMLFACLVDADFIETEAFYARSEGRTVDRDGFTPLTILHARLRNFMDAKRAGAAPTALNALRSEILDHVTAKAAETPGLFTLTVPTGGGKTLASLSFALDHAVRHGLQRVVYVIPFTGVRIETHSPTFGLLFGVVAPSRGCGSKHHTHHRRARPLESPPHGGADRNDRLNGEVTGIEGRPLTATIGRPPPHRLRLPHPPSSRSTGRRC